MPTFEINKDRRRLLWIGCLVLRFGNSCQLWHGYVNISPCPFTLVPTGPNDLPLDSALESLLPLAFLVRKRFPGPLDTDFFFSFSKKCLKVPGNLWVTKNKLFFLSRLNWGVVDSGLCQPTERLAEHATHKTNPRFIARVTVANYGINEENCSLVCKGFKEQGTLLSERRGS